MGRVVWFSAPVFGGFGIAGRIVLAGIGAIALVAYLLGRRGRACAPA